MQTTLLGIAFALILALLTALIGPFLVDWTHFRPVFETEASRMIGLPVRVTGTIDARILPTPSLTLHGLEIGDPKDAGRLRARALELELALGPLVRGELHAAEARLVGPQFTAGVNKAGEIALPKLSIGFDPDALSVQRLSIEDGRAVLDDAASGNRITLDKLWFNGNLRSLLGPLQGEGAFVTSGELYGYRITAGRLGEDGSVRLRLSIDPSDRPVSAEAEGALVLAKGRPHFDGKLTIGRPAGLELPSGETRLNAPWRVTSHVRATATDAKLEQIDFLYGAEESGIRLSGTADLQFGNRPSFHAVLSTPQLDLDRLIARSDRPNRLPADAVEALVARLGGVRLPMPVALSISADTVTLGGAPLQVVGGDLRSGDGNWSLDRLEFRAPGRTQVSLSGRLDVSPKPGFSGPVSIESNDPGALAAWLDGRSDPATRIKPFKLRGDIALTQDRIDVARFNAEVDHKAFEGKLHYAWATGDHPSRLDADLSAPELDVDSLMKFAAAVRAGSKFEGPREVALNVDIDRATVGGVAARQVQARIQRNAGLLRIERLSVADLGGAKFAASGQIDVAGPAPRGKLSLDLDAHDLTGVTALVDEFAPGVADPIRRAAARVPVAKLHAALDLDGPPPGTPGASTTARIAVNGQLGGLRADFRGQASRSTADLAADGLAALAKGDVRLEGRLDGEDGSILAALLGLDTVFSIDKRPGHVSLVAAGAAGQDIRIDSRIASGGLDGKAVGTLRLSGGDGAMAELNLDITDAALRPLRTAAPGSPPLPLVLRSRVRLTSEGAKLDDLVANVAGTQLRGAITLGFASPLHVAGAIDADTVDAAAVVAALAGMPPAPAGRSGPVVWSSEPFASGTAAALDGKVAIKVVRAALTPTLLAHQLRGTIAFAGSETVFDGIEAEVAGGRLSGRLAIGKNGDGLTARTHLELSGVDAAAVLPGGARPAVTGRLSTVLDLEANGLSPSALVGSLTGSGTVRLEDGYFSALDPKVFDVIIRASDHGLAIDTPRIATIVTAALERGRLAVPRIETAVAVNAGQVRLANTVAKAQGAQLAANASIDLTQASIDSRLILTGDAGEDGAGGRPDIFIALKGPLAAPQRTIDVSALAGWLTIRSVDRQAKKLQALEASRREALPHAAAPAPAPHPPAAKPSAPKPSALEPSALEQAKREPAPAPPSPPSAAPVAPAVPKPMAVPVVPAISAPKPAAAVEGRPQSPVAGTPAVAPPVATAAPVHPAAAPPSSQAPVAKPPLQVAPALPAPIDVRRVPRAPQRLTPAAESLLEGQPHAPLQLPSVPRSGPSVFDSLVGQ